MTTTVEKYGNRHWAIRDVQGDLLAVTVYRRGARRLQEILTDTPPQEKQSTTSEVAE